MSTILQSLGPDNVDIPPGLEIRMEPHENEIVLVVSGMVGQVLGTADELLAHAQVALDVME